MNKQLLAAAVALTTGCASHSHYAGLESRDIKALSPADIEGLKAGRGMSLALAAELNGYPGPLHVLELAGPLALTEDQRLRTRALQDRMLAEARTAGEELIARERELDRGFAARTLDASGLSAALARIAEAQARLRRAHLQAHLEQALILRPDQVEQYNRLRGYRN